MTVSSDSTLHRMTAMTEVMAELYRQDDLWGRPEEQQQTAERRLAILAEEFGEYAREVCERRPAEARTELIQVAAVAIANVQRIDAGLDRTIVRAADGLSEETAIRFEHSQAAHGASQTDPEKLKMKRGGVAWGDLPPRQPLPAKTETARDGRDTYQPC